MKKIFIIFMIVSLILSISSCTSSESESNSYNDQTTLNNAEKVTVSIENETLVKIDLKEWNYVLKKEEMPSIIQDFANQIEASGGKLALFGTSPNGSEGIRIITESANMDNFEYLEIIQFVNDAMIDEKTQGESVEFGNTNGIFWIYTAKEQDFKYFEYITKINKHNLRITMWTTKGLYNDKEQNFKEMIDSIEFSE